MIPVVIFTFDQDATAALMSARRVKALGFGPIFIESDEAHPVPLGIVREMQAEGFRVRNVAFPRVLNLLGVDCFKGLLGSYAYVFRQTGARILMKLDSDTHVNRADRLLEAVKDDVLAAAHVSTKYPFYGCCCLISARLVEFMTTFVNHWNAVPGFRSNNLPEDLATGVLADGSGLGEVRRWMYNPEGGFCAGWHFDATCTEYYFDRFDVTVFGNRGLLTGKTCERRDQVTAAMAQYISRLRESGRLECPPAPA